MAETRVIVVGAGHAGIEAALACARMGVETVCVTMRLDRTGHLPCNCSIGGPAKGHIAREVDALGGQMGLTTDVAMTHLRRVGTGKGPAIQTLRAHVCKELYPATMLGVMQRQPGLTLVEGKVIRIHCTGGAVVGCTVEVPGGQVELEARAIVLTTGTFLNGVCHEGRNRTEAARHGDAPSSEISLFLKSIGVRLRRFKTGTTPRIAKSTIDFDRVSVMASEPDAGPFSFANTHSDKNLLPCWGTRTTSAMHDLIRENLSESAMYGGQIEGVGPRFCPSIEDKIVRFADKDSHPIWLEQETWSGEEIYVQGASTSMPAWVQEKMLHTMSGLEHCRMIRAGYAVEYDMADPLQLTPHLMSKQASGLFLAGQLNGTSGYEEAAGQGLVAGINAARMVEALAPVDFPRSNSFIGVMVDDLVTKGVDDPYRMLTARAEHRLVLRHDNADARLTPLSRDIGLCSDQRWRAFSEKRKQIERGLAQLEATILSSADNPVFAEEKEPPLNDKTSLLGLLRRPGVDLDRALHLSARCGKPVRVSGDSKVREQLELTAAYAGYIDRQLKIVDRQSRLEGMPIPGGFDFAGLTGLSSESKEKLDRVQPTTVGQASRIPGVRPADIAFLIGQLRAVKRGDREPARRQA